MKLTVLGRYGPFPAAGGACSGYLLEGGDARVLIECGNGVLSRLQQHCSFTELTAVVLSHLHPDHISDLFVLRYALEFSRRRGQWVGPLPVYAPSEPAEEFARLPYKDVFDVRPVRPGDRVQVGGMAVSFASARHMIPACAVRMEAEGRTLVFSSDTGYSEEVVSLASGADVFLCEANLFRTEAEGHLNPTQAGEMAGKAGARRLLLTHLLPGVPEHELAADARSVFPAAEVVQESAVYIIAAHPGLAGDVTTGRDVLDDVAGWSAL